MEWDYDGTEDLVTISDLLPSSLESTPGTRSTADAINNIPQIVGDTPFHDSFVSSSRIYLVALLRMYQLLFHLSN
jgi:hypothetical protein